MKNPKARDQDHVQSDSASEPTANDGLSQAALAKALGISFHPEPEVSSSDE